MAGKGLSKLERLCFGQWLDIPEDECPPNFYRLIALVPFEQNPQRIDRAARETLRRIEAHRHGEHEKAAATLAQQIERVRQTLLDPQGKEQYDASLRRRLRIDVGPAPAAGRSAQALAATPIAVQAATAESPPQRPAAAALPKSEQPKPAQEPPPIPPATFDPDDLDQDDAYAGDDIGEPARPSRVWYWIAGGLAVNALALVAISVALLMRKPPVTVVNTPPRVTSEPKVDPVEQATTIDTQAQGAQNVSQTIDTSGDKSAAKAVDEAVDEVGQSADPERDGPADKQSETETKSDSRTELKVEDRPEPDEEPGKPFARMASKITLPKHLVGIEKERGFVVAGRLSKAALDGLVMMLDSRLCNLSEARQFMLVPQPATKSRNWAIHFSEPNSDASERPVAAGEPLAHLTITPESQLVFQWSGETEFAQEAQLANTILRLSHQEQRHDLVLRQPQQQAPMKLDLSEDVIKLPVAIDALPPRSTVKCELTKLDNFPVEPIVDPAHKTMDLGGEALTIALGKPSVVELRMTFEKLDESLQLRLAARYRPSAGARLAPFDGKAVKDALGRSIKSISKNTVALAAAIDANRAAYVELAAVASTKPRNVAEATELNNRNQLATTAVRSSESSIKRFTNSLPGQYEALGQQYQAAYAGQMLHKLGQIQFRIVARTVDSQIVLMAGQAEAPKPAGPIVLEGFEKLQDATGSWFQTRGDILVYSLGPGGKCMIGRAFGGQPAPGQWQQQKDAVTITALGGAQQYQMASPFQLLSAGGVSLYRMFGQ